jgi:hypothetical protein
MPVMLQLCGEVTLCVYVRYGWDRVGRKETVTVKFLRTLIRFQVINNTHFTAFNSIC